MMAQIAAASLVPEAKILAAPATVHTIPTSGSKEDFVSMGWLAAIKSSQVAACLEQILALEFLAAAQGLDFLRPLSPGRGAAAAYACIRRQAAHLDHDRSLRPDLDRLLTSLQDGSLLAAAEGVAGPLA
jgi:histidine ammonia-lyase